MGPNSPPMTHAVDQALAGDYGALEQLRRDTMTPAVPFSVQGVRIQTLSIKGPGGDLPPVLIV